MNEMKPGAAEKSQADKFRDLARELGCDEDEATFDAKLKQLAKAPPAPPKASE